MLRNFFTLSAVLLSASAFALSPGDIAFVTVNGDGSDGLAFIALEPIPPATQINFNDNEWQGSFFNTGESEITWTNGASSLPIGTIVLINPVIGSMETNHGSVSGTGTRGFAILDETIYAYQGNVSSPSFLTLFSTDFGSAPGEVITGTGLTLGENALDLDNDCDVAQYTGPATFISKSDALLALCDPANWSTQSGSGDESSDGIAPDVPNSGFDFPVVQDLGAWNQSGTTAWMFGRISGLYREALCDFAPVAVMVCEDEREEF